MTQEELQKALETLGKSGIIVNGDFVLDKKVENEIGNVAEGGIGIQINHYGEKVGTPMAVSDKEIKKIIEELMKVKDEQDKLLFRNKKQWWAVYRVLKKYCNYPSDQTSFVKKITDLKIDYAGNTNVITYSSLIKASNNVPKIATCDPTAWDAFSSISDNYKQQYEVADFLMQKLDIKS